jgi:hypothetical protein
MKGHWSKMVMLAGVMAAALAACERSATVDDSYYRLQMEQDLLNLLHAEDAYFTANATYSGTAGPAGFYPSYGVTVKIGTATATGWNATASHFHASSDCGIFVGDAPSPINGATKREPACP